jgi:hypothetical protein
MLVGASERPYLEFGNKRVYDLQGVFQLRSVAYGGATSSYSAFFTQSSNTAYSVPAGKTLKIIGTKTINQLHSSGDTSALGYGDNNIGLSSATPPTNFTGYGGNFKLGILSSDCTNTFANEIYGDVDLDIPATKYPTMYMGIGGYHVVTLYCREV